MQLIIGELTLAKKCMCAGNMNACRSELGEAGRSSAKLGEDAVVSKIKLQSPLA